MVSTKVVQAPPTPYDGDDELSDLAEYSIVNPEQSFSVIDPPRTPISASDTQSTPEIRQMTDTESEEDEDPKHRKSKPKSEGDCDPKKPHVTVDPLCSGEAGGQCTLNSGDYRKVTSHFFGRNKRTTHQIPDECWIKYCRKHYQRQKYRCPADWFETQLLLVDAQLDKMEQWGGVMSWQIDVRKKERDLISKENEYLAIHGVLPDVVCRERFLIPYLGKDKTFAQVRNVVNVINKECDDTKSGTLPSFEFLPKIDERRNPRPRRGINRRASRVPAQRTPTVPSTFRLEADESGQIKQIATKPRQSSTTGYAAAKARTLEMRRSSLMLEDGDAGGSDAEPKIETVDSIREHSTSPSESGDHEDIDQQAVSDSERRTNKRSLASTNDSRDKVDAVAAEPPRPVKRQRRALSL
ncbi:MAG: hypothetical protein Q9182_004581 [Xanthomendoza sp. 2 TL-2023]